MTRFTIEEIYKELNKKGTLSILTLNEAIAFYKAFIGEEGLYDMSEDAHYAFQEAVDEMKNKYLQGLNLCIFQFRVPKGGFYNHLEGYSKNLEEFAISIFPLNFS